MLQIMEDNYILLELLQHHLANLLAQWVQGHQ